MTKTTVLLPQGTTVRWVTNVPEHRAPKITREYEDKGQRLYDCGGKIFDADKYDSAFKCAVVIKMIPKRGKKVPKKLTNSR